jgi:hypothetical protein
MVGLQGVAGGRAEAIARAVRVWTGQLVDLTGRNNLLYYRDLKVGTLDLAGVAPELLFDVLGGKSIALSRLFGEEGARTDAVRRARAVRNRAQEHFEERGLETLYRPVGNNGTKSAAKASRLFKSSKWSVQSPMNPRVLDRVTRRFTKSRLLI